MEAVDMTLEKHLQKRLGFDFYDNEIIQMTAGSTGYDPEFIKNNDEQMRSSLLYDLMNQVYSHAPQNPAPKDNIFAAESKVINELASKGNCVVIGRCADYILRKPPSLHANLLTCTCRVSCETNYENGKLIS